MTTRKARPDTPRPQGAAPELCPLGDQAVLVRFGDTISTASHARVVASLTALDAARPAWVVDLVPAYASLMVLYDPPAVQLDQVTAWLVEALAGASAGVAEHRRVTVPVCYDPELGLDLREVAGLTGLDADEVVRRHTAREVLVYMLGFKPGFPYMGEIDETIAVPRRGSPRTHVPAGSVAVAGRQTGIYPVASPGGWRVLGRTPWRLFDVGRAEPFALRPGDLVRFVAIDRARFDELAAVKEGR